MRFTGGGVGVAVSFAQGFRAWQKWWRFLQVSDWCRNFWNFFMSSKDSKLLPWLKRRKEIRLWSRISLSFLALLFLNSLKKETGLFFRFGIMRFNEIQLLHLAEKAQHDNCKKGYMFKRTSDNSKWQLRWFVLYQNLLFYYENEASTRPSGAIFLEGCYCERLIQPGSRNASSASQVRSCAKAIFNKHFIFLLIL